MREMQEQEHSDWSVTHAKHVRAQLGVASAQMQVVIAEASAAVDARFDKNLVEARERAAAMRRLAKFADRVTSITLTPQKGPEVVLVYRGLAAASAVRVAFQLVFEKFCKDHKPLVEDGVVDSIGRFWGWIDAQMKVVKPVWEEFIADYKRDLAVGHEDNSRLAAEWASVDADGLSDA